jgi:hypothetical protein
MTYLFFRFLVVFLRFVALLFTMQSFTKRHKKKSNEMRYLCSVLEFVYFIYNTKLIACFRRPVTLATFVATSSAIFSFWQMWMSGLITRMLSACFPTLTFVTGLFAYINHRKKNALEVAGIFITKAMIKRAWELMRVTCIQERSQETYISHWKLKDWRVLWPCYHFHKHLVRLT